VTPADARPDGPDARANVPPPVVPPTARRILPAGFRMEGGGHRRVCSHGSASVASGTSWCAFSRPLGLRRQLLVIDPARAEGGEPRCDGSSPACILLDDDAFDPLAVPLENDAGEHTFQGDTLIYYGHPRSSSPEPYRGRIYAWRPGWSAGRAITSEAGLYCQGHPSAAVVTCIEDDGPDGRGGRLIRLHAGAIDQGASGPLPGAFAESPESRFQGARFTPDGAHLLYFLRPDYYELGGALWIVPTAEIGRTPARQLSAASTRSWALSADGRWWFYLRRDPAAAQPRWRLYRREFPLGSEMEIAAARPDQEVVSFRALRDRQGRDGGLGVLLGPPEPPGASRVYRIVKDPGASLDDPANVVTVAEGVSGMGITSPDLRYSYIPGFRGGARVARNDGTGECTLPNVPAGMWNALDQPFLDNGGLLFWAEAFDPTTQSSEGWLVDPADCTTGLRRFAHALDFGFADGEAGLLYSDRSDGTTATIRYARITGNVFPAEPQVLQERAHRLFGIVGPFLGVLVALDLGAGSIDGIYYHPIPR
jgi:hypothetical protein